MAWIPDHLNTGQYAMICKIAILCSAATCNNIIFLSQICEHKWKLFDISNGKWSTYHEANNKVIDEAFWAGETSVRIQFNRKKYTIQFGTMMQVRYIKLNTVMIQIADIWKPDILKIGVQIRKLGKMFGFWTA